MSFSRRLTVVCLVAAIGLPAAVAAHGPIHERIAAVTARLKLNPSDARLYVERGELEREHRDFRAALADFDRAAALDPHLETLDLSRARVWIDAADLPRARAALDRFVSAHPNHVVGRATRARVRVKLGDTEAAIADYTHAIALQRNPDYYLERAHAQVASTRSSIDAALAGLDEGLAKLGPLVTLQLAAIELELNRRHYDAALTRLDAILERAPRKEEWLARRGDVLLAAERRDDARAAYQAALMQIDTLPEARRRTKAIGGLELRLRAGLAGLGVVK